MSYSKHNVTEFDKWWKSFAETNADDYNLFNNINSYLEENPWFSCHIVPESYEYDHDKSKCGDLWLGGCGSLNGNVSSLGNLKDVIQDAIGNCECGGEGNSGYYEDLKELRDLIKECLDIVQGAVDSPPPPGWPSPEEEAVLREKQRKNTMKQKAEK